MRTATADFTVILILMKTMFAAIAFLFLATTAGAQKIYFIYIQSEVATPFFVKMGDKVFSSTAAGYLILPKLVDSVYTFSVGKTGQTTAESRFAIPITKKDHGYLLRETDGKMSLFDLQSLTLLQSLASANASGDPVAKRTDAFAVLLSQAANDPSLLEIRTAVATAQIESKKTEPTAAVVITTKEPEAVINHPPPTNDSATETADATIPKAANEPMKPERTESNESEATKKDAINNVVTTPQKAVPDETTPYKRSVVTRRSESSTSEGFGLTFLDEGESTTDTIRIVIPNQNFSTQKEESKHEDLKKFLYVSDTDATKTDTTVAAANDKLHAAEVKKRKACTTEATDKDFLKLRKSMAAKESDDAMINDAQKAFKKTCFSTAQIKNLSALFLTASGKYHFFDAAYGHVSNQEQYAGLQSELDDAYYTNRFKALIANQ